MTLSFPAKIALAVAAGLTLIGLSLGASYVTINTLIDDANRETLVQGNTLRLEQLVSRFKATESLQRRYLITDTGKDLDAYQHARQSLLTELSGIQLAFGPTEGGADFRLLLDLISRRMEQIEQTAVARGTAGLAAAAALVGSTENRQLHEKIDALTRSINNAEALRLAQSKGETQQTAQVVKLMMLLGGLVSLVVLAWAMTMIVRSQQKRRISEGKLSDSEALSRAITESMAEGVVTATQDGVIVNANSAARQLFGYPLEDLVGKKVSMLLPQRFSSGFSVYFAAMASRRRGFGEAGASLTGLRSNGAEFALNASFGDVEVAGRRLFTAIVRDITESKRISKALRDSEAQLRQVTDTVPALIAYVDKNQCFQFHSKAYEEALGLTHDQIHGKALPQVLGPVLYAKVEKPVQEALGGQTVRYEREQVNANGELREYVMNYLPRFGEGGEADKVVGFFVLGNDVTELKRIDRMKSEFVSTVSHELRTPLTSIRGSLGLVMGGVTGELPEKAKNLIGIAKNNCERLIRLINDILDSEKIESGNVRFDLQTLELAPLMAQVLSANEGFAAQHKVTLALNATEEAIRVHVDSDRLNQVVTNLLSNAIKFSPPDGLVQLTLRRVPGKVRVEISDKGPGIPVEFQGRIFQKFSQADSSDSRQQGGTGLGLNISRAILERMDGSIGFSTELGSGSTFFFELPEWQEAPPVSAAATLSASDRPRVLVCEEDSDVAQLIAMMLDKGGIDADVAHTATQARDYLEMTAYAAMTVDIKLPYTNGLDLVRDLRLTPSGQDLPVVVLSVTAREVQMSGEHLALGIFEWLEKPLDEIRLLSCLRQAIASGAEKSARQAV